MTSSERKYEITALCTNCEACPPVCPTGSIFHGAGQFVINRDTCEGCAVCVAVCPVDAIRPERGDDEARPSAN